MPHQILAIFKDLYNGVEYMLLGGIKSNFAAFIWGQTRVSFLSPALSNFRQSVLVSPTSWPHVWPLLLNDDLFLMSDDQINVQTTQNKLRTYAAIKSLIVNTGGGDLLQLQV